MTKSSLLALIFYFFASGQEVSHTLENESKREEETKREDKEEKGLSVHMCPKLTGKGKTNHSFANFAK